MAYKIVISQFAHDDEFEAYEWYELQRSGLGEEFLHEVELALQKISLHPMHYGFIDEKKIIRDYHLRRFPFTIVFKIDGEKVIILAVHHTSKHPLKRNRDS